MDEQVYQKAYNYAVYLLSLRLRTEGELSQKLTGKGYSQEITGKIVKDFKELSYLNDERFAQIFLDNLKKYKHFGFFGVKKKFIEKRLPRKLIEQFLDENFSIDDELAIAKKFLKKESAIASAARQSKKKIATSRFAGLAITQKQALARKLQSRGFRGQVIAKLIH